MDEMNEEQSPVEERPVVAGPGARLREARESRRLTIGQAAAQLRMQARIIEALENDDYSGLPGSTFVQGYLRSYSRLLGLPEQSIVGLAPSDDVKEPELVSSIWGGKAEVSSRDLPFRLVSFLILLLIVIGVGWWVMQHEPLTVEETPPLLSPGAEQGLALPLVTESQTATELLPEGQEEGVAESEASIADAAAPDAEAPEEEAPVAEPQPAEEQVEAPQPEPAVVTPPELTSMTPQSKLELEYQADCWSEISDAAGRQLAYGLIPAGRNLTLHGEAPFKVFLGFSSGVTIYYNGELYDHTPFQRGDVARFRIGRAEQNRPLSGN